MTFKTRRILFYSLMLAFFVFAALVIFYSNGWRFDLETFQINKLGAIFFENIPTDVTIKIEKVTLQFEPNFLKSSLLIANLFPKTYPATISKNGYQPWHKEIPVKPSLVAEIPPIILLPEKFALGSTTAKEMADFKLRGKNMAALKKAAISKFNSEETLLKEKFGKIKDIQYSPSENFISVLNQQNKLYLIDKNSSTDKLISENILISSFSPDSKKIAFLKENKDLVINWIENPSEKESQRETATFNFGSLENMAWHENSAYLFIKYPNGLYLLEANNLPPINFQVIDSKNQEFQYLSGEGSVYLLRNNSLYKIYLR